ncbi:hypothetical protein [Pseudomonas sp. RIT-PI-r]|uniref:hypothetical protein n=1 Tax=Pseudomonas sp. RIT-PI-r TaxID=1699620 RepID=UPI0007DADF95|nr:hypothetical protein [Pseudomonas sp. RIT-PI-r]
MTHFSTVLFQTLAHDFDRADYLTGLRLVPNKPKRGTVPTIIDNPFCGQLDFQDRYDRWSEDILSGVARLDHGGAKQLPVKTLYELLEALEVFSTETIGAHLGLSSRMARRYLSALEVALQPLMRSRPKWLRAAMGDLECHQRETIPAIQSTPNQMAQLRLDLGTDAFAI